MNNLQIFNFNGQEVTVVIINNEPWFIGNEVCQVLEITNSGNVFSRLKDYEKGIHSMDTPGGKQNVTIISESGLYRLVLTSRKPQAEPFQDWVVQEVLPTIRKTGLYNALPFKLSSESSLVSFEQDDYWVLSTSIAECFDKEHRNVLRDFDEARKDVLKFEQIDSGLSKIKIIETTYVDDRNRVQRAYKINRTAFNYVVLGYQGEAAKFYRIKFISAFEELEKQIKVFLAQQMIYSNAKRQQVYVLRNTITGMVKVGITNDIKRRVSELQNASGCEINVEYLAPKADNSKDIESFIHQSFAGERGIGEWFDIQPEKAISLLKEQQLIVEPNNLIKAIGGVV